MAWPEAQVSTTIWHAMGSTASIQSSFRLPTTVRIAAMFRMVHEDLSIYQSEC